MQEVSFLHMHLMHFSPYIYAHVSNRIMGLTYATNLHHTGARTRSLV